MPWENLIFSLLGKVQQRLLNEKSLLTNFPCVRHSVALVTHVIRSSYSEHVGLSVLQIVNRVTPDVALGIHMTTTL